MRSKVYNTWYLSLLICGMLALGLAVQVGAVTVSLEASQDNTLYENATGSLSNGMGQHFFAGSNGGTGGRIVTRGLIQFDLTGLIPQGMVINSVELALNVTTPMLHEGTVTLHRVLAPWGEGLSTAPMGEGGGGPSAMGDATWIHTHFDTEFWDTPGGDVIFAPSASHAVAANSPQVIVSTLELVADVQAWLDDPASNNGWLLRQVDEMAAAIRFASRNHMDVALHPVLTVDFSLPPMPISPQSGTFALTQVMDIVAFLNLPAGITPTGAVVLLDGVDVSASYAACFFSVPGTIVAGGQTFRCPSQSATALGVGLHQFEVTLSLSDGTSVQQAVDWFIVENTEP